MPDSHSEQLSAYLDGELDAPQRRRLEAHLAECAECAALLKDLRAIVAAAPHYQGREPSRELWQDIEARLDEPQVLPLSRTVGQSDSRTEPAGRTVGRTDGRTERPSRRFSFPQLIAASLLMTAVGGGATWLALRTQAPSDRPTVQPSDLSDRPTVRPSDSSKTVAYAEEQFDAAVRDLELILEAGRSRLDSATINTIELSLRKIDAAIEEARAAVQRDPANAYLSRQIAANMRRKLNLLRVATAAIAART